MSKPELLILKPIYEPTVKGLERDFTVRKLWTEADPAAYMLEACGNVRAAVTRTPIGFTRADFEALPKLEILACFGPTYELIDQQAARERGIAITYTPDYTAEPVADLALGMIVSVMRRLCEADRFVRSGEWMRQVFEPGRDVHGKTLGIVGFGKIGREIAGAALDVFRDEPDVPAELLKMDNVVLAPHIGTSTLEVRESRSRMLLTDLRAFFSGQPLINKVS